jgi:hypothetical protein
MKNTVKIGSVDTGVPVAVDEIAGVKFQRMKLTLGEDGVDADDISVSNPMPVAGAVAVINMIPAVETGLAKDGIDITEPTPMPTGGVGIRGWLSAIWTKLNGTLEVSGEFYQETQPVSATALPLPTGAATSTKQNDIIDEISNKDLMEVIRNLLRAIANPSYVDKSANQLRAQVTGTVTATVASTVISTMNAYAANLLVIDQNRSAWANIVRARIT